MQVKGAKRLANTKCTDNQLTANQMTGYDVDTGKLVAKGLGRRAVLRHADVDRDHRPASGATAGISPTDPGAINTDRMKRLWMTTPYRSEPQRYFVQKSSPYQKPSDLDGKSIGVCDSCTVEFYLRGHAQDPGPLDSRSTSRTQDRRLRGGAAGPARSRSTARSTPTSRPRPSAWRRFTRARSCGPLHGRRLHDVPHGLPRQELGARARRRSPRRSTRSSPRRSASGTLKALSLKYFGKDYGHRRGRLQRRAAAPEDPVVGDRLTERARPASAAVLQPQPDGPTGRVVPGALDRDGRDRVRGHLLPREGDRWSRRCTRAWARSPTPRPARSTAGSPTSSATWCSSGRCRQVGNEADQPARRPTRRRRSARGARQTSSAQQLTHGRAPHHRRAGVPAARAPQGTVAVSTVPAHDRQVAGQGRVLHPGRVAHRGGEPVHVHAHRQAHDHGQHAALPARTASGRQIGVLAANLNLDRIDGIVLPHSGTRHERRRLPRRARPPLRQQDPRHRRLRRGDPLARHRQRRGAAIGAGPLHQLPRRAGDRRLPLAARARRGAGGRDDPGARRSRRHAGWRSRSARSAWASCC